MTLLGEQGFDASAWPKCPAAPRLARGEEHILPRVMVKWVAELEHLSFDCASQHASALRMQPSFTRLRHPHAQLTTRETGVFAAVCAGG